MSKGKKDKDPSVSIQFNQCAPPKVQATTTDLLGAMLVSAMAHHDEPPNSPVNIIVKTLEAADDDPYGAFKKDSVQAVRNLAASDKVPTDQLVRTLAETGRHAENIDVSILEQDLAKCVLEKYKIEDADGTLATGLARSASLMANGETNLLNPDQIPIPNIPAASQQQQSKPSAPK